MHFSIPIAGLLAVALTSSPVAAQHYTARFFNSFGSPIKVRTMTFSPDGKYLAVSTANNKVALVSTATGDIVHEHNLGPFAMSFAADGRRLFMVAERDTQILDVANKQMTRVRWELPPGSIGLTTEMRSGKLIVSAVAAGGPAATSGQIAVGDELVAITTGGNRRNLLGKSPQDADAAMQGAVATPLTLHLVPRGKLDPVDVPLIRANARQVGDRWEFAPHTWASTSPYACLCFRNNDMVLLSAAGGQIISILSPVDVHPRGQFALSPDGRYFGLVASDRDEKARHSVEIYDVATRQRVHYAPLPEPSYYDAAFSPDSKRFLVGSFDRVQVLSLETGEFTEPFYFSWRPDPPEADEDGDRQSRPAPSPRLGLPTVPARSRLQSGTRILACFEVSSQGVVALGTPSGGVELWDFATGNPLRNVQQPPEGQKPTAVESVTFDPSGQWLAYYVDGTLHVVKLDDSAPGAETPLAVDE